MSDEFPPLSLIQPQQTNRRRERPRRPELPPEKLARRQEIARMLIPQVAELSNSLRTRSDEERKAIVLKLEHDKPVRVDGRDLKKIAEPNANFTLAVPKEDNLDKLQAHIQEFGEGNLDRGHAPHEDLAYLTAIKQAEPHDRLSQALFEQYDELIQREFVICEIEILSLERGANQQRTEIQSIRADLARAFAQGVHGTIFEQEEVKGTCRAVIRCTGSMFQHLVESPEWQRRISWFDARPQFETFQTTLNEFNIQHLAPLKSPSDGSPIVCIVDSGVTVENPFLKPVIREDLIRSFLRQSPNNPFDEYGHGSGVASLASYYALNIASGAENQGKVWIASARVLDESNQLEGSQLEYGVDTDDVYLRLFSQVLNDVVNTFTPFGVKIFNLSVGILNRKWNAESKRTVSRRSWIARTIDRLCREKDIVFVISTGNISTQDVRNYIQCGHPYPKYFCDDEASILDPGQSALALTVGSIAPSTVAMNAGTASAIALHYQPSPFTRCGPGINKEIKPELVELGGNYLIEESGFVRLNPGTNVITASHQLTPAISHYSGTSFATPRVAHKIACIQEQLESFGLDNISATLLKAFTVNSALYRGDADFNSFVETMDEVQTKYWLHVLGYGFPDENRATVSDPYSAVLFYQGEINPDTVLYFDVPVPACLADTGRGTKRLTVTVVHAPEVQRWGLESYFAATVKWRMFRGDIQRDDIIAAMSVEDVESDSEANEVELPNELKFRLGINQRSRGTVQHDTYEWRNHREEHSENLYTLAIASYKKWQSNVAPTPLSVVIRIEDVSRQAPVYAEVREILAGIEVQAQGRV